MGFSDPQAITQAATAAGAAKAELAWHKALVAGFLAGAFIALGGLLAVSASAGSSPKTWGALPTLVTGATFSVGLILVVIAGSELVTGNMALIPLAVLRRRASLRGLARNWAFVLVGNLLGALFVAYFLAVQSGVITAELPLARLTAIATAKAHVETHWQVFLRGVGCNWLVCLAVWMSLGAQDIARQDPGDLLPGDGVRGPGLRPPRGQHVLPAGGDLRATSTGSPGATRSPTGCSPAWATSSGGGLFVAAGYWYLYGREPEPAPAFEARWRVTAAALAPVRAQPSPPRPGRRAPTPGRPSPRRSGTAGRPRGRPARPRAAERGAPAGLQREAGADEPLRRLHPAGFASGAPRRAEAALVDDRERELRAHRARLHLAERDDRRVVGRAAARADAPAGRRRRPWRSRCR